MARMHNMKCNNAVTIAFALVFLPVLSLTNLKAQTPNSDELQLPAWSLEPGRMIDVGGFSLSMNCFGEGSPTIVLESGGGWGGVAFADIIPALAEQTRVCTYDRAGLGFSDIGPVDEGDEAHVRNLAVLLDKSGEHPPYILAGWSLGGMIVREYTWRYPENVVGVVTIDGSTFDYEEIDLAQGYPDWYERSKVLLEECIADAEQRELTANSEALARCAPFTNSLLRIPEMREAFGDRVLQPERYVKQYSGFTSLYDHALALKDLQEPFGDIPLRVMVAGYHFGAPRNAQNPAADIPEPNLPFLQASTDIAKLSENGLLELVVYSGHMIQRDRPQVVIDAILEVLEKVRD